MLPAWCPRLAQSTGLHGCPRLLQDRCLRLRLVPWGGLLTRPWWPSIVCTAVLGTWTRVHSRSFNASNGCNSVSQPLSSLLSGAVHVESDIRKLVATGKDKGEHASLGRATEICCCSRASRGAQWHPLSCSTVCHASSAGCSAWTPLLRPLSARTWLSQSGRTCLHDLGQIWAGLLRCSGADKDAHTHPSPHLRG
ncbi:hypothetical protein WJX73_000718 [Symbiochloris irregularis]|uniref:Uncharacterized protein n=1 Tax=Symbiochloris irregularis TaxID=706552 RepID=A0AAW1PGG3_9CHLO